MKLTDYLSIFYTDAFYGSYIEYATLHVPTTSIDAYNAQEPWRNFKTIVGLDGTLPEEPEVEKCATPTISYVNGKLAFSSETEGAEFVSEITDTDVKKNYTSEVNLTVTYNISVYATKAGYDNSDVATATLCWIDVIPEGDNVVVGKAEMRANPVLIKSNGGMLTIEGVNEGTPVNVYDTAGRIVGMATAAYGTAIISTTLRSGEIGIVKIGEKAVKVVMK